MRIPASTYRLQITSGFDLHAAAGRLAYLHDLGVDWVYLSPLLEAAAGSTHGYDVVDPSRVDESRGGSEGLAALSAEARRLGMGVLVDIVPNHMGVAVPEQNPWWWDLLRRGRGSAYADAFDVDWARRMTGRVLVPVVGDDDLLDGGRIANLRVDGAVLRYHDTAYPIAPGTLASSEDPDDVHGRQHYRLVSWRRGDSDLNYRRFFTITTLAGIKVEDPEVLGESHAEIRRWFADGLVDGLRVDHPDGLQDPRGYLGDLAAMTSGSYVLVEKILEPDERLSSSWPTAGTTGYDALGLIDRVLVDPAGAAPLDALEARLRGGPVAWDDLTHDTRRAVAERALLAEVRRIVREVLRSPGLVTGAGAPSSTSGDDSLVEEVAQQASRDHGELADAVAELLACFPVYRSYLPEGIEHVAQAFAAAHRRRPDLTEALDALAPVLTDPDAPAARRFQQTSGMVMAKGVEDCAFYRYSRLTSLNEVGGDPSTFALSVDAFHAAMTERQQHWPHAMTTTTTHDTKRSEDTRARISVLAEVPERLGVRPRPAAHPGAPARPRFRGVALAGGGRRLARVARTPAPLRREGDARGWGPHHLDRSGRGLRGRRARRGRRGLRLRRGARGRRRPGGRGRRARPEQRAERQAARPDRPRRAGRLPGHRAVGPQPGRPGQPPRGRLR